MAASSAYLRHGGSADHSWILMGLAMLALALGCGYTLAVGEMAGLYVAVSLVGAVAVLFDFRAGVVLMLLMLPTAASALFPHALMGITGLNPLNLVFLATVASFCLHAGLQQSAALVPKPLIWLFIVPIVLAGLNGVGNVHAIPPFLYELEIVTYVTETQYLLGQWVKPMVMVVVAVMIGAAAARSAKPERFIVAIALSVWLIGLIQIGFVAMLGVPLATMATTEARNFYEPLGMHANGLGRLHLFAFALLLFVWAETRRPGMKLFLLLTLGILVTALLLTFSRTAIAGAGLVGALFLMWKFNARTLAFSIIALMLVGVVAAEALFSRMTLGFGEGADAMSAGRIEGIWLPLLPDLAKSPLWGNGLDSILWSSPMLSGAMTAGHPHNAYLEALLDTGVVGLALLLAYYAHVWKGFRTLGSNASLPAELRGLFQGGTAALVAFFVACLTGSSLRPDSESAYLWIAIGLMYGLRGRKPAS